jgi:hypothetical protein
VGVAVAVAVGLGVAVGLAVAFGVAVGAARAALGTPPRIASAIRVAKIEARSINWRPSALVL